MKTCNENFVQYIYFKNIIWNESSHVWNFPHFKHVPKEIKIIKYRSENVIVFNLTKKTSPLWQNNI